MEAVLLVGLGGGLGAVLRYAVALVVPNEEFPWATLAVNVLGSFGLGLALFGASSSGALLFFGVGFCGAFTTFSTFSYQTVVQWERDEHVAAGLHAFGTLVLSGMAFGAAWLLVG